MFKWTNKWQIFAEQITNFLRTKILLPAISIFKKKTPVPAKKNFCTAMQETNYNFQHHRRLLSKKPTQVFNITGVCFLWSKFNSEIFNLISIQHYFFPWFNFYINIDLQMQSKNLIFNFFLKKHVTVKSVYNYELKVELRPQDLYFFSEQK